MDKLIQKVMGKKFSGKKGKLDEVEMKPSFESTPKKVGKPVGSNLASADHQKAIDQVKEMISSARKQSKPSAMAACERSNAPIANYACPLCDLRGDWESINLHLLQCLVRNSQQNPFLCIDSIFALNDPERLSQSLPILRRYVQNVLDHPSEPKYRKIRLANKAFCDHIQPLLCVADFFGYCGFERVVEAGADGKSEELYRLSENVDQGRLRQVLHHLESHEPYKPLFKRDCRKYNVTADPDKLKDLPDEVYKITEKDVAEEMRRIQNARMESSVLKLRNKNPPARAHIRIRVRFPDSYFLEASFQVHEATSAIYQLIYRHLTTADVDFILQANQSVVNRVTDHAPGGRLLIPCSTATIQSLEVSNNMTLHVMLLGDQSKLPKRYLNDSPVDDV